MENWKFVMDFIPSMIIAQLFANLMLSRYSEAQLQVSKYILMCTIKSQYYANVANLIIQ